MPPPPTLILIYGPPAVGKLTVAKALARRAPFRVLHNHVTINAVSAVFEFGSPTFMRLVGSFRQQLLEAAAEERIDVVCTYVFAVGDEPQVERFVAPFERRGGRVLLVQLVAPRETLLARVGDMSRGEHDKLTNTDALESVLARFDVNQRIPGRPSLTLNTTELTPDEAVERILGAL